MHPNELNGYGGFGNEVGPCFILHKKPMNAEELKQYDEAMNRWKKLSPMPNETAGEATGVNLNPTIEAHEVIPKLRAKLAKFETPTVTTKQEFTGTLEVDLKRGVVYFFDITFGHGHSHKLKSHNQIGHTPI
jgi:hypothetical protein